MQSKSLLSRILAMALCLALTLSCLPGMAIFSTAAGATAETEAASDLLDSLINSNPDGLVAAKNGNQVYGFDSLKSWEIKAENADASGAVLQIPFVEVTDFTNCYLTLDAKYVPAGDEESAKFSVRLHNGWSDLDAPQSVTVTAGDWQTFYLTPGYAGWWVEDLSGLATCARMTFQFTMPQGGTMYIDNVRAVKIESAEEDWINLPVDSGAHMTKNTTYEVVNELTVDDGSSQAMKLVTGDGKASIAFNTKHAVEGKDNDPPLAEEKRLSDYPDMTSGILSGWFYFGDVTPSAKLQLYIDNGNGKNDATDLTFEDKGNGWYYGYIDCATVQKDGVDLSAVDRVVFSNLPRATTIYIDRLTLNKELPTSMDGLSIAYPYNTETYQQDAASVTSRFDALTFYTARNEVESAQMILTPDFSVDLGFELTMSNLVNTEGNHIILADAFDVYVQRYVEITESHNGGNQAENGIWNAEAYDAGDTGIYPDALIPQEKSCEYGENTISAGNNQGIWVNLNVGDTAPGTYTGTATLRVNNDKIQIPVSVTVYDVELPDEVHVKTSAQIWWDDLQETEGYDFATEYNRAGELARKYEAYLISKRLSPYDSWNRSKWTEAMPALAVEYANDPLVSAYAISYKYITVQKDENGNVVYDDEGNMITLEEGDDYARNLIVKDSLTEMLTALIDKNLALREEGDTTTDLFEKAYYYFGKCVDEPRSEVKYAWVNEATALLDQVKAELAETYADEFATHTDIRDSFMNLKHLVTGPDPQDDTYAQFSAQDYTAASINEGSFIYTPQHQWFNTEEQRALYANEDEVWWYGCEHPVYPYAGTHINDDLISARTIGWMMYDYNIDGYLIWSVNAWDGGENVTNWTSYAETAPGDGVLIMPGKTYGMDEPIGTIRLETLRESFEDYEYLWLLENEFGISDISTYTAGLYEGTIPNRDSGVTHHTNRIALLEKLQELNIAQNGATVVEPDLPTLPMEPAPEIPEATYPVDILEVASSSKFTAQEDGSWYGVINSSSAWTSIAISLDKNYDISDHMLVMDAKFGYNLRIEKIDDSYVYLANSTKSTGEDGWATYVFDLSANSAGYTYMSGFSFDACVATNTDLEFYLDNVYLVPRETLEDDWIHVPLDAGQTSVNAAITPEVLKAQNSGMSMKLVASEGASPVLVLQTETTVKPDFTSGTLAAWFYFGNSQPNVSVKLTNSSWKASNTLPFEFVYGGNGWYYGTLDVSKFYIPENVGDTSAIIRIQFNVPAGYDGYVDGITFNNPETVVDMGPREDLSAEADWTNMTAKNAVLTEEKHYAEGSSQSLQATGNVVELIPAEALDLSAGTLGAWFYFGDAEPSAQFHFASGDDYTTADDGKYYDFDFADEGVDGWYYGTLDCAQLVIDEETATDFNASTSAVTALYITVSAGTCIDCMGLEAPEMEADLFNGAEISGHGSGEWQTATTNGSGYALKMNLTRSSYPYVKFTLTEAVDISKYSLVLDVMPINTGYGRVQLTNVDSVGVWSASISVPRDEWTTVSFDLSSLDIDTASSIQLGLDCATPEDGYGYYIDNVHLAPSLDYDARTDLLANAKTSYGTQQTAVVNGENSSHAWMIDASDFGTSQHIYADFTLDTSYDVTNKLLVMDVRVDGATSMNNFQMDKFGSEQVTGVWTSITKLSGSLSFDGNWQTLVYDVGNNSKGAETMNMFGMYIKYATGDTDFQIYFDNVRLLEKESTEEDLLSGATYSGGKLQFNVTNGSTCAWQVTKNSATNGSWPSSIFTLDKTYDISNHFLLMDVHKDFVAEKRVNITHINGKSDGALAKSHYIGSAGNDGWVTILFDLTTNGAGYTEMSSIGIGTEIPTDQADYNIYFDNVRLVRKETLEEDLLSGATATAGAIQYDVTNGDSSMAWEFSYKLDAADWKYPVITLDKSYDISNHILYMDIKVTTEGTDNAKRVQLANINELAGTGFDSTYTKESFGWKTFSFDLSTKSGIVTEMNKFTLGIEVPANTDFHVYVDNVRLVSKNPVEEYGVTLGDDIGVGFNLNVAETDTVAFTVAGNAVDHTIVDGKYMVNVAAAQMNDAIAVSVNGNVSSKTYSVCGYAQELLDTNPDAETTALVQNMLMYGASAQAHFGYNAENPVTTDQPTAIPTGDSALAVADAIDGLYYYGATLVHESKTAVRIYFSGDAADVEFKNGDTVLEQKTTDKYPGKTYVEIDGINPQNLGDVVTVTATKGEQSLSVSYSPLTYIVRMYNKAGVAEDLKTLLSAMFGYYEAAVAYTTK